MNFKMNDINSTEISEEMMKAMVAESNSISNKEALKDKIHQIHNYIRNNGAGYGMNALKVFNLLYGLKKIEENKLLDKINLKRPDCEFSYLVKLANEDKNERIAELIFGSVLQSIFESEISYLLFYEIPRNIKGSVLVYLIKEINSITMIEKTCNVLLSGKIYEYFIGRDESAISELGAYYTDRHIVEFILKKLNPSINEDKTVPTMVDMFGGSGGFTTGYIQFLNTKYPKMINWETEIHKIAHYDMNEDVIKSAGLEIFCLTGSFPDTANLTYKNSFKDCFGERKYKYPLTNPPYGGDKSNKTEANSKREKVKEYIKNELLTLTDEKIIERRAKQLKDLETQEKIDKKEDQQSKVILTTCSARIQRFARFNNKLKAMDKESCSLILLMDILDVGGTAIGVLKEGLFFNTVYKDLRKCLIEKFNVREIISVPRDQFENTTTKTSIVIFDNTEEKTNEVKFSDLVVKRYTEDKYAEVLGDIVICENKDDIKEVIEELIITVPKERIIANTNYSLSCDYYNVKDLIVGEDYKLITLGDIITFLPKSKRKAGFGQPTGQYNFYTSSFKVQKCDVADYNEESLIIGNGGVANIKIDNKFSCSDHNYVIKTDYTRYIYYILIGNIEILEKGFHGSVLQNLSKEYLKKIKIPMPKTPKKLKEWVDKISEQYNRKHAKQALLKTAETNIQAKIQEILDEEDCDDIELEKLCDIRSGNHSIKKHEFKEGPYLVIGGGIKAARTHSEYNCEENTILCAASGTIGFISMYPTKTFLTVCFALKIKDYNLKMYIYNYLKFIKNEDIIKLGHGSVQQCISKTQLNKFKIGIPKNKKFIEDLEPAFKKIEKLQNKIKIADELYNQYIKELSLEAIPPQPEAVAAAAVEGPNGPAAAEAAIEI